MRMNHTRNRLLYIILHGPRQKGPAMNLSRLAPTRYYEKDTVRASQPALRSSSGGGCLRDRQIRPHIPRQRTGIARWGLPNW